MKKNKVQFNFMESLRTWRIYKWTVEPMPQNVVDRGRTFGPILAPCKPVGCTQKMIIIVVIVLNNLNWKLRVSHSASAFVQRKRKLTSVNGSVSKLWTLSKSLEIVSANDQLCCIISMPTSPWRETFGCMIFVKNLTTGGCIGYENGIRMCRKNLPPSYLKQSTNQM